MFTEDLLEHVFLEGVDRTVAVHVLLFINSLKLALEETEHRVAETFGVHVHPLADLVGREGVEVHRLVVGGTCVQTFATHLGEDHIYLVRNGVVG